MATYELSGAWFSPPDRGSPEGDWNWFKHSFEADSDSAACQTLKDILAKEYASCRPEDFRNLKLIKYEEIDLARVLA